MKRTVSMILAVLLVVTLLAACGGNKQQDSSGSSAPASSGSSSSGSSSASPAKPETQQADPNAVSTAKAGADKIVNIAISENCITLDPHNLNNVGSNVIVMPVYETLLQFDHAGNFYPWLATKWEYTEDGKEWTFYLRDNVYFSNGDKLCADDVVCTYQRIIDDYDALCYGVSYFPNKMLAKVEKIDDMTVKMYMSETYATVQHAFSGIGIIPHTVYEKEGVDMFYNQNLVATGPWILDEWVDGQYGHYHKNPNYWNKANYDSYYDEMYIRHVLEASTGVASHLAGDIDANIVAGGINPDMLPLYAGTENEIQLVSVDVFSYYYLGFQCGKDSPFADIKVRQAFELAIDRQSILDAIMGGGTVLNSIIPIGEASYNPDLEPYPYDPAKAEALLKESSYDGREIVLSSNTSTTKAEEQLLAMSDMLNAVGFKTSVQVVENATLLQMRKEGNYDVFLVITMHTGGDPTGLLNMRIREDAHTSEFVDAELNGLIEQAMGTVDQEARNVILRKAMVRLREVSAPHTGLYAPYATFAISYGIEGLELYADGTFRFAYVDYDPNATTFVGADYEALTKGL